MQLHTHAVIDRGPRDDGDRQQEIKEKRRIAIFII
jgi:hypothetical protein